MSNPNREHYNHDIDCLINQLPGELGVKAAPFCEVRGTSDPSDDSIRAARMDRALPAVAKWRKLNAIMSSLGHETQRLLMQRYRISEREHSQIVGLHATFGDLKCLAWYLCKNKDSMRDLLSRGASKRIEEVESLRVLTEKTNIEIHRAWLDAERNTYRKWADRE
jgi:hypothetical protein